MPECEYMAANKQAEAQDTSHLQLESPDRTMNLDASPSQSMINQGQSSFLDVKPVSKNSDKNTWKRIQWK